jgi:PRTRC genetic system protein E
LGYAFAIMRERDNLLAPRDATMVKHAVVHHFPTQHKAEMDTMPTQAPTATEDETTLDAAVDDETDAETEANDEENESAEGDDEAGKADDDAEESASTEADAVAEPFVPSPPLTLTTRKQPGIIQGLASSIPVDGSVLVAITKTASDMLLVTIQPTIDKDNAASAKALQIKGTPEEIDRDLLAALAHYVPARELVLATAEQIAKDTASAAAHAKAEADKRRANSSNAAKTPAKAPAPVAKARQEALTVKTLPITAKITVTDHKGKAGEIKPDTATNLDIGTYTVLVESEGYESNSQTVRLLKAQSVVVALKKTVIPQPSLLG